MKGYAVVQTGLETRVKVFKTFEEASSQAKAWLGELIIDIVLNETKETLQRYIEGLEISKEKDSLYIYDGDLDESTEIVEVEIPE